MVASPWQGKARSLLCVDAVRINSGSNAWMFGKISVQLRPGINHLPIPMVSASLPPPPLCPATVEIARRPQSSWSRGQAKRDPALAEPMLQRGAGVVVRAGRSSAKARRHRNQIFALAGTFSLAEFVLIFLLILQPPFVSKGCASPVRDVVSGCRCSGQSSPGCYDNRCSRGE